ncbi:MAG: nicotinate-nucleotide adenylyltransferase [Parvularculaceae bacterium]
MDAVIPQRHDTSRIGILGGSFNPAHEGHREISLAALKLLQLDAVWWLVSPGNPLKDPSSYAPYPERLAEARRIANHHRIVVSNFEERKNLQYTVDTIDALQSLWPQMDFVWLMGADSLETFDHWKDWRRIAAMTPIAVFSRPGHEKAFEIAQAAKELGAFLMPESEAASVVGAEPPAWTFISSTANPASATELRKNSPPGVAQ